MNRSVHNRLVSFIWSVADDCLRDVYNRGKYRDVILPMAGDAGDDKENIGSINQN
jgi:type I restriction-modification system DNA methylase subunit